MSGRSGGHSFPLDLGKEKPRNQGIEWKRLDPGAGDHPPSSSSCSTTANANHPRASTANSTVLARQARDETRLDFGRPGGLRVLGRWPCAMYPSTQVPHPSTLRLLPSECPPLQSLRTTSLSLKYPGHIITFKDQGCCWTATPLLSCLLFVWALYAPALLPLIPSFYLSSIHLAHRAFPPSPCSFALHGPASKHPTARCSTQVVWT